MRCVTVTVLLLAAMACAQQWQVELVDPSCRPTDVFVRRDSGRTYVAYVTGEGSIRIAFKDTVWHYETLDTSLVRPDVGFHLALGSRGRLAVSGVDDSVRPVVLEKSDSGWSRIWTHEVLQYYAPLARAVYGADSTPMVIYCANHYDSADVIAETKVDSVWQADTAVHLVPPLPYECELGLYDADCNRDACPCVLASWSYWFPLGKVPPSNYVIKGYRTGGKWSVDGLGGFQASVGGYDIVAGNVTASAAVYSGGRSLFNHDPVWPGRVTDAAVQVDDSAGRGLMAFVTSDSVLRVAFKGGFWHFCEVPGVTTARCCDLALDDYGQPLIAFEDANGVSLAHGIDVVGVSESLKPQASSHKLAATVVLSLPQGAVAFDAMGRRVVNPRSGIYFVREAQAQSQAIRKVVVQR